VRHVPKTISERLAQAPRAFAVRGYDDTRIEDIATACGVPKSTLYYYFDGKEELFAFLLQRMLARAASAVSTAIDEDCATGAEQLRRILHAQVAVMATEPDSCQLLLTNLGRAGAIPRIAEAVDVALYAPLRAALAAGRRDGTLRAAGEPETIVAAVYGAVTIAGLHYIVARKPIPRRVARDVVGLLLNGLAAER
jgi:TetR/AcrR family transcriptional regulator